ncbi:MAG: hypothetical protein GY757_20445 [bacterium]|nr:hypothetical protein [bacterium]
MTRKLIKPDLNEIKKYQKKDARKKPPPAYKTHAENYYYIKQMNNRTHMVIELVDGNAFKGRIEWYDSKCLKIKTEDGENYIVFKHYIKYMYKNPEFNEEKTETETETEKEKEGE